MNNAKPSTQNSLYRILVVEDDAEMLMLLTDVLSDEGFAVSPAANGAEAALKIAGQVFNLVITDMKMPRMEGLELLSFIREKSSGTPVIVITAFGDRPSLIDAYKKGAVAFISKPFKMMDLKNAVNKALNMIGPDGKGK